MSAQPNLGKWQWAKKGGGVGNFNSNENEQVNDICTDKYGNVYTTGNVYSHPVFEGVMYNSPLASFGNSDAYLAKYDKCGHLKWVRFGGSTQYDGSVSLHIDDSLNVIIIGTAGPGAAFPDSTHTLHFPNSTLGGLFWAKYDSLGNIKWLKASQSGYSIPFFKNNLTTNLAGNLITILALDTGSFYPGFNFNSNHFNSLGFFELDLNGNPISILPFDSIADNTIQNGITAIAYDSKGNLFIDFAIFDTTRILLLDTVLTVQAYGTRSFLLKWNPQTRRKVWLKDWQGNSNGSGDFTYFYIDKEDNVLAEGGAFEGAIFNQDTIRFNTNIPGVTINKLCFKLDSNGNTLWHIVADNTSQANISVNEDPIAPFGDNYICAPLEVFGPTYWGGDTFNSIGTSPVNWTAPYFLTFIDSRTGKVVYGDSLAGSSLANSKTQLRKIVSDPQGNVYLGGYFSSSLIAGDTIQWTGGNNDAFVVKWGLPCPDTSALIAPLAAEDLIASASGPHAIDVNWKNISQYANRYRVYRSTTDSLIGYSLIDSVSKYTNRYTDVNVTTNQIYWYRVSAVNEAGEAFSNSDSAIIRSVGIAELSDIRHIALYPNPASNYTELSVWSEAPSSFLAAISITDMEGREFYIKQTEIASGKNDFSLNIADINSGIYIVNLRSDHGVYSKRLVVVR
jgi:hypothetical protein